MTMGCEGVGVRLRRTVAITLAAIALVAGAALVLTPGARASGPLVRGGGDCFNHHPTGPFHALPRTGAMRLLPITVLARPSDQDVARRYAQAVLLTHPIEEFEHDFRRGAGHAVHPPSHGPRLELYVVAPHELPGDTDGIETAYCGANRPVAVAVSTNLPGANYASAVIAHEIFHAFQAGAAHGQVGGAFWVEATAEFGARTVLGARDDDPSFDNAFIRHPERALDHVSDAETDHQYGAFRFVQWLSQHMPDAAFWSMLVWTFPRLGGHHSDVSVVRRAERRAGRSLDEDLGRFWADHLTATDDNGPAAPAQSLIDGERAAHPAVGRLSAHLFRVTAHASTRRLRVTVTPGTRAHQLWIDDGTLTHHDDGYSHEFCVGATAGGLPRWPGQLGIAYTNTSGHRDHARVAVDTESAGPCAPPNTCATAARVSGRTPLLSAAGPRDATSCQPPPPPGHPCSGRDGSYDTYDALLTPPGQIDRVYFDVFCVEGQGTQLNGFGGAVACPAGGHSGVDLGPSGGSHHVGQYLNGNGSITFTYTYLNATITVTMQVAGTEGTGTVTVQTPSCSRTMDFAAPWRSS
jgi:hypothetical protein